MTVIFGDKDDGVNLLNLSFEEYNTIKLGMLDNIRFLNAMVHLDDKTFAEQLKGLPEGMSLEDAREQMTQRLHHSRIMSEQMQKAQAEAAAKQN